MGVVSVLGVAPATGVRGPNYPELDTAYKATELSDYSVCTTWLVRGNHYYLLHVLREKLLYPDLKKTVIEHARKHGADAILIENKGSGMSLIDDLRREGAAGAPMPIAIDPEKCAAILCAALVRSSPDPGWSDQLLEPPLAQPRNPRSSSPSRGRGRTICLTPEEAAAKIAEERRRIEVLCRDDDDKAALN